MTLPTPLPHVDVIAEMLRRKAATGASRGYYETAGRLLGAALLLDPVIAMDSGDGQTERPGGRGVANALSVCV